MLSVPFDTGLFILLLTLWLDALELSFKRSLWFVRTLRFWLYFSLHFAFSCMVAYAIRDQMSEPLVLAIVSSFVGVGVIPNSAIKVGGYSIAPLGNFFTEIKSKMFEQAAEDKAHRIQQKLKRPILIERLQSLPIEDLEKHYQACLHAEGVLTSRPQRRLNQAFQRCDRKKDDCYKLALATELVKRNRRFVEMQLEEWLGVNHNDVSAPDR